MDTERARRIRAAMAPPWDELRERRVLSRVLQQRSEADLLPASGVPGPRPARRPAVWWAAGLAAAAIGLIALLVLRSRAPGLPLLAPSPSAVAVAAPSLLKLQDGSWVSVEAQAEVRVVEDQPSAVRLLHLGGKAFYDVQHNPARPFSVRVADVTVRVRGTQFSVELSDDWVEVRVIRGRVLVDDGSRATEIVASEVLRVRAWHSEAPPGSVRPGGGAPGEEAMAAPRGGASGEGPSLEPGEPASSAAGRPGAAVPETSPESEAPPTVEALLSRADAARAGGRWGEAAQALRQLLSRYPRDPRRPTVLFTLARVQRSQGQHAAAAETFEQCARLVSRGALGEDSLAEAAASWSSAGSPGRARAAARRYLTLFPQGVYAARMRALGE